MELGRTVRGLSYGAVDAVLSWAEGACKQFLADGTEPTPHVYDGERATAAEDGSPARRTTQAKAGGALGAATASMQGTVGRHLRPVEGVSEPPAPEFGLSDEPPFPGVTTNSSGLDTPAILNRVWEMAKEVQDLYNKELGTQSERQLRVIKQYELAAEALIEELGSAG